MDFTIKFGFREEQPLPIFLSLVLLLASGTYNMLSASERTEKYPLVIYFLNYALQVSLLSLRSSYLHKLKTFMLQVNGGHTNDYFHTTYYHGKRLLCFLYSAFIVSSNLSFQD